MLAVAGKIASMVAWTGGSFAFSFACLIVAFLTAEAATGYDWPADPMLWKELSPPDSFQVAVWLLWYAFWVLAVAVYHLVKSLKGKW